MPESPVPPSTTKPQAIPASAQQQQHHHQQRPTTTRAATLSTLSPFKGRATSQPPGGDRLPVNISSPGSGRASPGLNGNGGAYGVIGGSRTPGRFGGGLPGPGGMRAMSFSAAESRGVGAPTVTRTLSSHIEEHPSRSSQSTSPFPTFSPTSSVSASPAHLDEPLPLTHSPPRAEANVSRSRSQSLAGGPRPTATERFQMMPMSALENAGAFPRSFERKWSSPPETSSNMSPFARGMPALLGPTEEAAPNDAHSRWLSGARNAWGASVPDKTHKSPLSSSVARALGTGFGVPSYSTVVGGFGTSPNNNTNGAGGGGRSGSSSRRHSVSVLGGRRDVFGEAGGGMSAVVSPPGRGVGPLGFSDEDLLPEKLGNALNLEIDANRKKGIEIELRDGQGRGGVREIPISQSLPKFDPVGQRDTGFRASIGGRRDSHTLATGLGTSADRMFGTSPARGRPEQVQTTMNERDPSRDSRDGSARSRFSFDAPASQQTPTQYAPTTRGGSTIGGYGSQYGGPGLPPGQRGMGQMGGLGGYDPRMFGGGPPPQPSGPFAGHPFPSGMYQGPGQGQGQGQMHVRPPYPGPGMGPGGPTSPSYSLNRPPPGFLGYFGGPPSMHGPGPQGRPPPPHSQYGSAFSPGPTPFQPHGSSVSSYYPQSPTSPNMNLSMSLNPNQHSPSSFSQLSLADLGKGVHIGALPPTTPLYVVTFKAGRRDVFYCPDPTLLISNGDRVIVEADRGSDLGTVVYDQLTPAEVREWQEKQATAALLSGASQHQPPGMAVAAQSSPVKHKANVTTGELAGLDLPTLLAGVGPGGQLDLGQTTSRGPLAKEIMPKRIFTKSSQGPEEQTRMSEKLRDEQEALIICREKVLQRGLPMTIVDAEYQWDRRKLTFYFKSEKRVDFRELTKENFRIFKSRIWMSMVPKDDPRVGA